MSCAIVPDFNERGLALSWTTTILAGLIGLFLGGFPGFLLGLFVGFCVDSGVIDQWRNRARFNAHNRSTVQAVFFDSTFKIMGFVAKADGHVSAHEIQAAEAVMRQLGLNAEQRQRAIELFTRGKQGNFNLDATLDELRQHCWHHPSLLKTFLEIQIQMAYAGGEPSRAKRRALENVCQRLGLMGFNFDFFEQQFRAQQNYHRSYQQHSYRGEQAHTYSPHQQLREAYQVLGVDMSAAQAEVTKAYRKLMSQNHPDRLIAKGLPEEMIKVATAKTQKIKQAYEDICKAKGW